MTRSGPLAGKTILVTGAGSGIGRASARRSSALGADLVLAGRRPEALRETLPGALRCRPGPRRRRARWRPSPGTARLWTACSCAPGNCSPAAWRAPRPRTFDRMIAANLRGPWLLCHHLGPRLRDGASVRAGRLQHRHPRHPRLRRLFRGQGRGAHAGPGAGPGVGRPGHPLQRHRPGPGAHRHGRPAPGRGRGPRGRPGRPGAG